jgi:hypothetical protein
VNDHERMRVAGIEAIVALVMLAGGAALTRVSGFLGVLGLVLVLLAAMGLAHAILVGVGVVSLPGEDPGERAQRERVDADS